MSATEKKQKTARMPFCISWANIYKRGSPHISSKSWFCTHCWKSYKTPRGASLLPGEFSVALIGETEDSPEPSVADSPVANGELEERLFFLVFPWCLECDDDGMVERLAVELIMLEPSTASEMSAAVESYVPDKRVVWCDA